MLLILPRSWSCRKDSLLCLAQIFPNRSTCCGNTCRSAVRFTKLTIVNFKSNHFSWTSSTFTILVSSTGSSLHEPFLGARMKAHSTRVTSANSFLVVYPQFGFLDGIGLFWIQRWSSKVHISLPSRGPPPQKGQKPVGVLSGKPFLYAVLRSTYLTTPPWSGKVSVTRAILQFSEVCFFFL